MTNFFCLKIKKCFPMFTLRGNRRDAFRLYKWTELLFGIFQQQFVYRSEPSNPLFVYLLLVYLFNTFDGLILDCGFANESCEQDIFTYFYLNFIRFRFRRTEQISSKLKQRDDEFALNFNFNSSYDLIIIFILRIIRHEVHLIFLKTRLGRRCHRVKELKKKKKKRLEKLKR